MIRRIARSFISGDIPFLVAVTMLGAALRLDLLWATGFHLDADEAIVGLMGKHFVERGVAPIFYYGQPYMGSLEALLAGMSFLAFGVSAAALKLVPLLFSLVLIYQLYCLAGELGGRKAARLAALLTAVPPSLLLLWSGKARGGFIEVVSIGALALLLLVQWLRADVPTLRRTFWIGCTLGFGWWVNNQIIYFMLATALWMALRLRREPSQILRHGLLGAAAFLLGGAPFWIYNCGHQFASFGMFGASGSSAILAHITGMFGTALPILLGARRYWQTEDLFAYASPLMWLLYAVIFGLLVVQRRAAIARLFRLRIDVNRPVELLLVFMLGAMAVYCISAFGDLAKDPRYLLPLYVAVIPLSAISITQLQQRWKPAGIALGIAVLAFNLGSLYWQGRAIPGEPHVYEGQRVSPDHSELIAWLKRRDIQWVRTNYWIGYRLAFETEEDVRFVLFGEPRQVRVPEYERDGRAYGAYLRRLAFLPPPHDVVVGTRTYEDDVWQTGALALPLVLVPRQADVVRAALNTLGYDYREDTASDYIIIYDIQPVQQDLRRVSTRAYRGQASVGAESANAAYDGDVATRWGSGRHQEPGMRYVLNLEEPRMVRALHYDIGTYWHDYPRGLRIELEYSDGSRAELCSRSGCDAARYFAAPDYFFYLRSSASVRRIVFTQEGEDPIFDWSIAELELYE